MDEAYKKGLVLNVNRVEKGYSDTGTRGRAYLLWDKDALYMFVKVSDRIVVTSASIAMQEETPWFADSVELFLDLGNDMHLPTKQYRVSYSGYTCYMETNGANDVRGSAATPYVSGAAKLTDDGYDVEMRVNIKDFADMTVGYEIGVQILINDMTNSTDRKRAAIVLMPSKNSAGDWAVQLYDYVTLGRKISLYVENPFEDIADDHPNLDAITYVYNKGLLLGTSTTQMLFSPDMTLTRAQFVTLLGRMAGVDPTEYTEAVFSDVDPQTSSHSWFAPYVAWANENNIVNGYPDGTFGPNDKINNEQAISILARYARMETVDTTSTHDISGYGDIAAVSSWAVNDMRWAVENGIYTGESNKLLPKTETSRLLTAVLVYLYETLI